MVTWNPPVTGFPTEATDDDRALVAAALEDTAAFAPLYERHAMVIYRYCLSQVHDVDQANDLTAQIFIRAIERLHQYRSRSGATFRSWLFAIARSIVADHWRRRRPHRPVEPELEHAVSDDPGPETLAIHHARMDAVFVAIDSLPQRYRDIVNLRLAGLTSEEIAASLGISVSAMKSAQTRAYRLLRNALVPQEGANHASR